MAKYQACRGFTPVLFGEFPLQWWGVALLVGGKYLPVECTADHLMGFILMGFIELPEFD